MALDLQDPESIAEACVYFYPSVHNMDYPREVCDQVLNSRRNNFALQFFRARIIYNLLYSCQLLYRYYLAVPLCKFVTSSVSYTEFVLK